MECEHFTCCLCGEWGDVADQHAMIAVSDGGAFEAFDRAKGYGAGVYRITGTPYYGSDYIASRLDACHLQLIGPLPRGVDTGVYPCGHFCRECQAKVAESGCPATA